MAYFCILFLSKYFETKTLEEFYRCILPCSAGMCTNKILWNNENEMCKLLTVFLAQQSWAKKSLTLLLKIQDVSRLPDTVAAVKIHSYVTAYGIFQHRHIMHLSLAG